MRGMHTQGMRVPRIMTGALAAMLAVALVCALVPGCASDEDESAEGVQGSAQDAVQTAEGEEATEAFTAHGSEYGKAETVTVGTTLAGEMESIAVTEWIKNPDELQSIEDVSTLDNLTVEDEDIGVSYMQDGEQLTWATGGQDVNYTGTTSQELPFDITYKYKLDGEKLEADELEGLTGTLQVTIGYENLTSETIELAGGEVEVQQPYLFASVVTLDTEHVRDVTVEGGTTIDYSGSLIAVGIGMPGLAETLGIEEQVELPDKVTITAEVCDYDMASIMTIVTDEALAALDEKSFEQLDETLDDAFGQLDSVTEALGQLSEGMEGVDTAISTISAGQAKLNDAFPNATDGLVALAQATEGAATALSGSATALEGVTAAQASALEQLQGIDATALSEADQQALAAAIASITAAQQGTAGAAQGVAAASAVNEKLESGLDAVTEGLEQIQAGYEQLEEGMATVNTATSALSEATEAMSAQVVDALDEAQVSIGDIVERVQAVSELAASAGAFCGSADGMPATTLFMVTASA